MTLRREVQDFVDAGPLPPEEDDEAVEARVVRAQELLEEIPRPVTDEEAQALAACFGPDSCYGLSWSLLHLVETAPGRTAARYEADPDNPWVRLLDARVADAARQNADADADADADAEAAGVAADLATLRALPDA